jgi:hypothetical protein
LIIVSDGCSLKYSDHSCHNRGRNGFDGDMEALVAYRDSADSLNRRKTKIIADDYNYALAA